MNYCTVRDLRTTPKTVWQDLFADGGVIITQNGKPTALMLDVSDGSTEETLHAVKQLKANMAFTKMRGIAASSGWLSPEEIDAEISSSRKGD